MCSEPVARQPGEHAKKCPHDRELAREFVAGDAKLGLVRGPACPANPARLRKFFAVSAPAFCDISESS